MELEKKIETIKAAIKKYNFLEAGITGAGFFPPGAKRLFKRQKEGKNTPFVHDNILKRVTPKSVFPWARSCIIVSYPFYTFPENIAKPRDGYLRGRISVSALGRDYHLVLTEQLKSFGKMLLENNIISKYSVFVDATPLCERELALRSGIGKAGKNNSLITAKGGSFVFLGGLAVDTWLEPGPLIPSFGELKYFRGCRECKKCINSCPGNALKDGNTLDYEKCVSYLTVKKGYIPKDCRSLMGDSIYGCDVCFEVCPLNVQNIEKENSKSEMDRGLYFQEDNSIDDIYPRLDLLLKMSKRDFKIKYEDSAIYWRGKTVIQRNAAIAIGNLEDPAGVYPLLEAVEEKGEIVAAHALWALGKLCKKLSKEERKTIKERIKKLKGKRYDIFTEEFEKEYNSFFQILQKF